MSVAPRVQQQAAYILHHRPFRDSSQILDVLSRDHGKVALVARGSRGTRSRLKGVLRPFLPLRLSWVQKSDMGTLTGAESAGAPFGLSGDALMAGYYVNELLLNFLHRHDPQPEIFDLYGEVLEGLRQKGNAAAALRHFEIVLLELLGYALSFDREAAGHTPVDPQQSYEYRVDQGPVPVQRSSGSMVFSGDTLLRIGQLQFEDDAVLRAANQLLRRAITHHLGGKELKTRKVLADLHRRLN